MLSSPFRTLIMETKVDSIQWNGKHTIYGIPIILNTCHFKWLKTCVVIYMFLN